MKVFSFGGWSGSGKTSLIVQLIKAFKTFNQKILALKRTPGQYHLQPEGKDSALFLHAGADEVILASQGDVLRIQAIDDENTIINILKDCEGQYDFALLEGFYHDTFPLLEVFRPDNPDPPKFSANQIVALISPKIIYPNLPTFPPDAIQDILAFLTNWPL